MIYRDDVILRQS